MSALYSGSAVTVWQPPQVRVCRCGAVHTGEYAAEEYQQHQCLHDAPLRRYAPGEVVCPACGQVWEVRAC